MSKAFAGRACTYQRPQEGELPTSVRYPTVCKGLCCTSQDRLLWLQRGFFDKMTEVCPPVAVQTDVLMVLEAFATDVQARRECVAVQCFNFITCV